MAETKKVVGKIKKKKWFEIIAPNIFKDMVLGETLVTEKEKMLGKQITTSLANLTGDVKRQSTVITFKVTELKGDKAYTEIIGYSILLTYIKRMVRKGRERVDSSFICRTKDNQLVRAKFVLVTRSAAKHSVLSSLRKVGEETVTNGIKNMTYLELINDIIAYKLQRTLKDQLKKIFPLKISEIRHISLITGSQLKKKEKVKEAQVKAADVEQDKQSSENEEENIVKEEVLNKEITEADEDAKTDN